MQPVTTTNAPASRVATVLSALTAPKAPNGLAALRILYGLLALVSTARFMTSGWIEAFYGAPDFQFKFILASWAITPPTSVIYWMMGAMLVAATGVIVGVAFRASLLVFLLGFTYVELLDVTNYLNHYYA